jgi:hypothetical protein
MMMTTRFTKEEISFFYNVAFTTCSIDYILIQEVVLFLNQEKAFMMHQNKVRMFF